MQHFYRCCAMLADMPLRNYLCPYTLVLCLINPEHICYQLTWVVLENVCVCVCECD